MKALIEYDTHHYWMEYELDREIYCPACGASGTVWVEVGGGDYYAGPDYVCLNCSSIFSLPFMRDAKEKHDIRLIEQLKCGEAYTPITPTGN